MGQRLIYILLLSLFSTQVYGERLVDRSYNFIADTLFVVGTSIDNFFARSELQTKKNDTQIKISSLTRVSENEQQDTVGYFRFNLKLPQLEEKFQLLIERDNRENTRGNSENPRNVQRTLGEASTFAGLQFILEESKMWSLKTSMGARVDFPPKLYGRVTLRRSFYSGRTHSYPVLKTFWQDGEGWSQNFEYNMDTRLTEKVLFRWVDHWFWNDQDFIITQVHGPSFYYTIDEKRALSYNARMSGDNDPHEAINNYNFNIRYRQLLYSHWFFGEVSPQIDFAREQQFKKDLSFELRFEIVIVKI